MFGCFSSQNPKPTRAESPQHSPESILVERELLIDAEKRAADAQSRASTLSREVEDLRKQVMAQQHELERYSNLPDKEIEIQLLRSQLESLTTSIAATTALAEASNGAHAKVLQENQRLAIEVGELRASLAASASRQAVVEVHGHNEEVCHVCMPMVRTCTSCLPKVCNT